MKSWAVILSVAGVMFASQVQPAQAINKEWSAALGFLGGVIVANNYGGRGYDRCSTVTYQEYCPPPVVYSRPYCPPPVVVREEPSGHYELVDQQVWVPGTWQYQNVGCNTYRKTWCPGYYRTETVRVWVEDGRGSYARSRRH